MGWVEKDQPTPFDDLPLPGLWFLDGDAVAQKIGRDWTAGQKYSLVVFPSGEQFDLWETGNPAVWGNSSHFFGLHGVVKQKISFQRTSWAEYWSYA